MSWKKITAFCMAFALAAGTASTLSLEPQAAPIGIAGAAGANTRATTQEAATLAFVKDPWDNNPGDTSTKTAVSGTVVNFTEDTKAGFQRDTQDSFTYDAQGQAQQPNAGGKTDLEIKEDGGNKRRLIIANDYPADDRSVDTTIMFNGNYYTLHGTGIVIQQPSGQPAIPEETATIDPQTLQQYGEITLQVDVGERPLDGKPSGALGLSIVPGSAQGAFGSVTGASALRRDGMLQIELYGTSGGSGNQSFFFAPYGSYQGFRDPNDQNIVVDKDSRPWDATNPNYDPDNPPMDVNDIIRAGTKFTLILRKPVSNTLSLTIKAPMTAVNEIANRVDTNVRADGKTVGKTDSQYITLDTRNSLEFITEDFWLVKKIKDWNAEFNITWTVGATTEDNGQGVRLEDLLTIVTTSPPPPDNPNAQNEVTQQVILNKDKLPEKNVEGTLKAVVSFTTADGKETFLSDINVEIPIIVRGKGIKPRTLESATWDYNGRADLGDAELTATRKNLSMDVFRGGIPGYKDPKNPYQYDLNLEMGSGNGWAEYVRIDVVNTPRQEQDEEGFTGSERVVQIVANDEIQQGDSIELSNPGKQEVDVDPKKIPIQIIASHRGSAVLTINYGQLTASGEYVDDPQLTRTITLDVDNTSPSDDARLQSLVIKDQEDKTVGYKPGTSDPWEFDMETTSYIVEVPYTCTGLRFIPTNKHPLANKTIEWQAYYLGENNQQVFLNSKIDTGDASNPWSYVSSGTKTDTIGEGISLLFFRSGTPLPTGVPITVTFRTTAQNPTIHKEYTLNIIRRSPSIDANLTNVEAYREEDREKQTNLTTPFNGETLVQPVIYTVPYMTDWLNFKATPSDENAKVVFEPPLTNKDLFGEKEWLQLENIPQTDEGLYLLKIKVWSESTRYDELSNPDRTYELRIKRADPSRHSGLGSLGIADTDGNEIPYTPAVNENTQNYLVKELPYQNDKLQLKATQSPDPENPNSTIYKILAVYNLKNGSPKFVDVTADYSLKRAVTVDFLRASDGELPDTVHLIVASEACYGMTDQQLWSEALKGAQSEYADRLTDYTIEINRQPPSDISDLKDLKVKDGEENDLSLKFTSNDYGPYYIDVPYSTDSVSFTPFLGQAGQRVWIRSSKGFSLPALLTPAGNEVKGADEAGSVSSRYYELNRYDENPETEFTITVWAEDSYEYGYQSPAHSSVYRVIVRRAAPSTDARLRDLTATNVETDAILYPGGLRPPFTASTYDYEATLLAGQKDTVVTATTNDANATIEIEGVVVGSGVGSDPIPIIYVEQTVTIVVTAEDGVTTETYTITFTNPNMIEKNTNADLKYLEVNYAYKNPDFYTGFGSDTGFGLMTPDFKPSTTDYEVTVAEDCYQAEILARPADKYATMEVFQGTLAIGDYNGNFSTAVADGETQIAIVVTASDGVTQKTYNISIFRGEEDKLKEMTPLDAEDIDFENSGDIITVAIDKYPRVNANVFAELKNYPEKTIIFQGNDYSLEFRAADLNTVVPQEEIFDFRMFFTSPQEDAIMDLIERRSANDDLRGSRLVMLYFPHHGTLPGPAVLHVNLGYRYRDDTLYWHYHNEERERIDYYGALNTNAQGTFAVTIDHLSTYIATRPHYIYGAELMYGVDGEDALLNSDFNKVNPWTGVPEETR